ncbi:LOW QUALITY PROTEIN: hypothetical protein CVT26_010458, partial [Gymnopilus dilepis]
MASPSPCKFCADLNELRRFKLYRSCDVGAENCEACLELKQVEEDIAKAMKVVDKLFEYHREVRTRLNRTHDPLVNRIPPEITSYIFQLSVPSSSEDSNLRNMTGIELRAPTILSAVCTAWRRLALSTPQLWAHSRVSLTKAKKREMKELDGRCDFFHERLRRSGQVSLTICLIANWLGSNYPPATDLVKAIVRCSDRWRVLDVECEGLLSGLLIQAAHRAPNLQTLRLKFHDIPNSMMFIASGARLKELYLDITKPNEIDIDWSRLTTIHLTHANPSDCFKVLLLAPLLERCRFSHCESWILDDAPLVNSPTVHKNIRELALQQPKSSIHQLSFLQEVTLPALQSLTFPGFSGLTPVVMGLLKRSCCTVQELIFTDGDERQIVHVLRKVPSLRRLICFAALGIKEVNKILRLLLPTGDADSTPAFSPGLEHLELTVASPLDVEWSLLADIIRPLSGVSIRPALHSVKVDIHHDPVIMSRAEEYIDLSTLQRLQNSWKDGFDLRLNVLPDERSEGYDILQATLDPASWQHITDQWGEGDRHLYRPCDAGTLSCGACTELEKVESAIDKAMQVVGELFERHREIRTRLNRVHDPLVKKIPPEIISYIFQLSMPPFPTDSDLRNMTSAELRAPIILSAVCTAWRRVALSTPQLWTLNKVSLIEDRKRHMKELEGRCGFFHERLRRSGRLPVAICLTANWKASNYPPAIDLVKAIIQCSDRWHLLDLECDRPLCCLLSGASHRAPNLRALRLRLCNDPENMSFVASEARLEEVYLQSTRVSKIDIDWRRVTTIHLSGAKSSDCVEVLRRAPWLERCRFSN